MKTIRTVLSAAVVALLVAAPLSASAATPDDRVSVRFVQPERFTDVRGGLHDVASARDALLADLQAWIEQRANPLLGPGQRLEVSVTDIDLAGDFEPLRRTSGESLRVVRGVTPPRIDLDFKLVSADSQELRSGSRKLRDLGFQTRLTVSRSDPLRFEKGLLADWMSQELR